MTDDLAARRARLFALVAHEHMAHVITRRLRSDELSRDPALEAAKLRSAALRSWDMPACLTKLPVADRRPASDRAGVWTKGTGLRPA